MKNADVSRIQEVCHVIYIFLDFLEVRYDCVKFERFQVEDWGTHPIHEQPPKKPILNRVKLTFGTQSKSRLLHTKVIFILSVLDPRKLNLVEDTNLLIKSKVITKLISIFLIQFNFFLFSSFSKQKVSSLDEFSEKKNSHSDEIQYVQLQTKYLKRTLSFK